MPKKRLLIILFVTATLLLIPFVAMQFTNEVHWTLSDFVAAGVLLLGAGIMCDLAIKKIKTPKYLIVACAFVLALLFLIWAELAVGIF